MSIILIRAGSPSTRVYGAWFERKDRTSLDWILDTLDLCLASVYTAVRSCLKRCDGKTFFLFFCFLGPSLSDFVNSSAGHAGKGGGGAGEDLRARVTELSLTPTSVCGYVWCLGYFNLSQHRTIVPMATPKTLLVRIDNEAKKSFFNTK